MTLNDLAFNVALAGDNGTFEKITEIGWSTEEQFLTETAKRMQTTWSYYDDGRKVMNIRKSNGEAGLDCKFIVKDGWLATLNYPQMELQMDESRNKKTKLINAKWDQYDSDDDWDHDETSAIGYSQADLDNHANQCNPNNDAYHSSRK